MGNHKFSEFSNEVISYFKGLQDNICQTLERLDGEGKFQQDNWQRPEGGGGRTRIISGQHIEKGGVNFSAVNGEMPEVIAKSLGLKPNQFLATGVSIVLHSANPFVPIIHMNVRYFETNHGDWWFGGGIDLTPLIVNESEAQYFHEQLKIACDKFGPDAYSEYKKWADDYFFIPHRNETRGVGGIFFDKLHSDNLNDRTDMWQFVKDVGETFAPTYSKLFTANYRSKYSEDHKNWQLIRRGRYVEFNLVYDRGTKFGLQTNGRIESILMSLPPQVEWKYDYSANFKAFEKETQTYLKKGINWIK